MQYADNRALRELMYRAYVTRAAEFGNSDWNNTPLIDEILAFRRRLARLLGYDSYAQVSLQPKMARSPDHVLAFLADLAARAKPFAQRDFGELSEFARTRLGLAELQAWDVAWVSEKLRVERYAFSEQEVKQYFPETKVLPGMFRLVETLYGIRIQPGRAPTWHPDVRFYEIRASSSAGALEGELIGQFYLDLFARPSKRGGAWMDVLRRAAAARPPSSRMNSGIGITPGAEQEPANMAPGSHHRRETCLPCPVARPA
jgi:oligopeptidase A